MVIRLQTFYFNNMETFLWMLSFWALGFLCIYFFSKGRGQKVIHQTKKCKILFICKKNENYGFVCHTKKTSGLFNSTRFIVEALRLKHVDAKIVEVIDNNCIDREVSKFKPDLVIIEAFWVVPEKFDVLKKLHPHVKWYCHLHSDIPFLALEGIAMEWAPEYLARDVGLIANSIDLYQSLKAIFNSSDILYLPNVYLSRPRSEKENRFKHTINIGCFGAIRPLKNQLLQAIAAIEFAKVMGKGLNFYVNATRVETGGEPVLKNIRELFRRTSFATLVEVPWLEPQAFLDLLHSEIDIGMQVSFTETFNVVSADYITAAVPLVVSDAIPWVSAQNRVCNNSSMVNIVAVMKHVYHNRQLVQHNQELLLKYAQEAIDSWLYFTRKNSGNYIT